MARLVALDLPGGPGFVEALRRVWDAGDAALPLDPRLPGPARRVLLDKLRPAAIRTADDEVALDGARPVAPGDALVVATSGTSGQPKGVVLTRDAVEASAQATSRRIGVRPDDHWLACLPLSHIGGLSVVTRALALGTPLTVHPGFDAAAVQASDATLVSLVPTALARIDPTRFRVILLGGTRPPALRPANCLATYGMTETGSGIVYDGVPLAGVEIDLADDGEIRLRGPMLLRCYRTVDSAGPDSYESDPRADDGWFPTGDIGRWVGAGDERRLEVSGRRGDVIVTGGEKVWPDAVERALGTIGGAAEFAVAGAADAEWGSVVVVYVVRDRTDGLESLESLRERVKQTLPAYCAPRRLVEVESLPRTALGKVRRSVLDAR